MAISEFVKQDADTKAGAWRVKFYLLWSALLALKLLLASQLQLFGDEAFYAWEAARPAWAYSDLPGMTAWLIRVGVELGGYYPFAARLSFICIGAAMPFLIIRIARHFSNEKQAWQAGALSCCLPLLLPMGVLALPEAPLCLAALLCFDASLRMIDKCETRHCLQLAAGLALGALTHYRFAIILLAGAFAFALVGGWRHLRNPQLLLALLLGACAWLPLFFYNQQHDLAGWQFQFVDRNPWQFSANGFMHLPLQAVVTTPFLYVGLLWGLWQAFKAWRLGSKKMGFVFAAAFFPLMMFAVLAFFVDQVRTSFHWPLQAYLPLIAVLPFFLGEAFSRWRWAIFPFIFFSAGAGLAIAFAYLMMAAMPQTAGVLAGNKAYPDNFLAWNAIAEASKALHRENEILVADNFMLAAQLRFAYAGEQEPYVLNHLLNEKHGRARQLQDWQRDEAALLAREKNTPVLIIIEETATKEWLRDGHRAELCKKFNSPRFEKVVYGPGNQKAHGKYFSIFRARLGASSVACAFDIPKATDAY